MTATATAPSEKQRAFLGRLADDVYGENAAEHRLYLDETLQTKQDASREIERLLAAKRSRQDTQPEPPEGVHYLDGTIYKVKTAKGSGKRYATTLDVYAGPDGDRWVYVGRKPFGRLSAATLLTLDQARAFGAAHGICAVCGATLSDPDSVERGIGPVCATRV